MNTDNFVDESDLRSQNILLLYGHLPEIHIYEMRPLIKLTGNVRIVSQMKDSLADMLVIGHEPPLQSVEPLNNYLFPHWKFWWQRSSKYLPLSINACESPSGVPLNAQGTQPSERHYQLGAISPGCRCNHCSGFVCRQECHHTAPLYFYMLEVRYLLPTSSAKSIENYRRLSIVMHFAKHLEVGTLKKLLNY